MQNHPRPLPTPPPPNAPIHPPFAFFACRNRKDTGWRMPTSQCFREKKKTATNHSGERNTYQYSTSMYARVSPTTIHSDVSGPGSTPETYTKTHENFTILRFKRVTVVSKRFIILTSLKGSKQTKTASVSAISSTADSTCLLGPRACSTQYKQNNAARVPYSPLA